MIAQILDENNPDAEGSYVGDQLHAFTCPCKPCAEENSRIERLWAERGDQRSEDERYESFKAAKAECQERIDAREWDEGMAVLNKWEDAAEREYLHLDDPDYPDLEAAMNGDDEAASKAAMEEYSRRLALCRAADEERQRDADTAARNFGLDLKVRAAFRFTLPLVPGDASEIPPILTRSDGATLLYEARLNSIFGEPSMCKTWIGVMAVIEALRAGGKVLFWDFDDRPSTLVTRPYEVGSGRI